VAAEKPFGTSLSDADSLHKAIINAGVPEGNLHLVDHWLSFFMNRHLPTFRPIVEKALGIEFSKDYLSRIVITEFETRGLEGRGDFFDGVGQVRDMVQSHLLQVMALTLLDPTALSHSDAKLSIFQSTRVSGGSFGQYYGFLLEPKLKYHNASADATLCQINLDVSLDAWANVPITIQTGKDMGTTLYAIDFHQKDGRGILTYEIGKEETGVAGIKVTNWALKDSSAFKAPLPGFQSRETATVTPNVQAGNGYILKYDSPDMYFPKPYGMMTAALLKADYSSAFVSYPECHASWEIVNADGSEQYLDPAPREVKVYKPPAACGNTPPNVCYQTNPEGATVRDLYDITFKCTPENDAKYANVSFYQAKCHPKPRHTILL